jgi:Lamin Tail Domain
MVRSPLGFPGGVAGASLLTLEVLAVWLPTICNPAGAALVINEILIDPTGSDGGKEFVELLNTGVEFVDLTGVEFQFANGADGPVWKTRWSADAGQKLAPGEYFLITDRNWMGSAPAQAEVYLGLQNGPDAVRLAREDIAIDLLGYGPLTDSALMETRPAATVTGRSLSRRPDGRDTNCNEVDFVAAAATPGARNFKPWSMALVQRNLEPPCLEQPGQDLRLEVDLKNDGTHTIPIVDLELRVGSDVLPARLAEIQPDDLRTVVWNLTPTQWGSLYLRLYVLPPAVPDTLVLDLGRVEVGPGDLLLSEIMPAPDQGQQEWIEIQAGSGEIDIGEYSVRDEDGAYRPLPSLTLPPGELVVLSADSVALISWLTENRDHGNGDDCAGSLVAVHIREMAAGWPTLNNTSASGRDFADRLYLADSTGTVVDQVTWGGTYPGTYAVPDGGRSLERIALRPSRATIANWTGSTAPAGSTPGCPNSVVGTGIVDGDQALEIVPRVLDAVSGAHTLHIRYQVPMTSAGGDVRIFDLWGGLVRDFGADRHGAGPRDLLWDGRNEDGQRVSAGAYVVLLLLRAVDGSVLERHKALVAVRQGTGG